MKSRKLLYLLLFSIIISHNSYSQFKKDWGFWVTDTTADKYYSPNYTDDLVLDQEDNIYIQFTKDGLANDTLFIQSYSPTGSLRWEINFFEPDTNGQLYVYKSDFRYDKERNVIESHYMRKDSLGNHLVIKSINTRGNVIKVFDEVVLSLYDYNLKKSFTDKAGNYFTAKEITQGLEIVVIDSMGTKRGRAVHLDSGHYANHVYDMKNLNSEQIVIFYMTSFSPINGYSNQINTQVLNKADLSIYSSHHYQTKNDSRFVSQLRVKDERIYLFGNEFWQFDKECNVLNNKANIPSAVIAQDNAGFYMTSSNEYNYWVQMFDFSGVLKWGKSISPNSAQSCNEIKPWKDYLLTQGNLVHRFESGPPVYTISRAYGTVIKKVSKWDGDITEEYIELFDSIYQPLAKADMAVDSKGSGVVLANYTIVNPNDPSGDSRRTAYYLYKVCDDCGDDINDIVRDDSNFVLVLTNPSRGLLQYQFAIVTPNRVSFDIYDMSGKVIYKKKYKQFKPGFYQNTIDLNSMGLAEGTYFLSMQTVYNRYSKKFIYKH